MYAPIPSTSKRKRRSSVGFSNGFPANLRILLTLSLILSAVLPAFLHTPLLAESSPAVEQSDTHTTFTVRIENISGDSQLPGPFAPGVWAVHDPATAPLFEENVPDRGLGLAAIAEDGNPADLAGALQGAAGISSSGVFNTPAGADGPGPLFPGHAYEFQVDGMPGDYLSFASMLVQSNDIFVGPGQNGLALFDQNGNPINGDITHMTPLWDVGSEQNEAPGMGPNQAPRQSGPNTGPGEGGVSVFSNSTRSLPLAGGIVDVTVAEDKGTYTIKVMNVSATSGSIDTPIAPLFYATHNSQWSLFADGQHASPGLEMQAEDGSPAGLVDEHNGAAGTGMVGAAGDGPVGTGDGYTFQVTPNATYPYLTFSGMVVQTNDAFFAPHATGIALLNSDGSPRSAQEVEAAIARGLAIWDAGTEANEVPGVGVHQAPRQTGPNSGPADPVPGVRIYSDSTNDLVGENAGGFIHIAIEPLSQANKFLVSIKNTSDDTVYPGILTPVAWATHNSNIGLFEVGKPASHGLETLAEDGDASVLAGELAASEDVAYSGVVALPNGGDNGGPLMPGDMYRFVIEAKADAPYFSFAQMIVPSNDTFAAFRGSGIRLFNEDGTRRSAHDLAAEIATTPLAWDAGTELNQAGAAGPDQAPRQAGGNTGADEGNGTVRLIPDNVWDYPTAHEVVRITIKTDEPTDPDPGTETVFEVNLSGATEVPGPGDPDGRGVAKLSINPTRHRVCYELSYSNIQAPTAGHIHTGAAGTAGGVLIGLFSDEANAAEGCVEDVDPAAIAALLSAPADYYVNIHNAEFPAGAIRGQVGGPSHEATTFRVKLTNISGESDLPGPFAPGVYAVHGNVEPLFTVGQPDRGDGLAALAEDGNAGDLANALSEQEGVAVSGVFNTPVASASANAAGAGPIFPGDSYEFEFTTTEDASRLSLATMLVQTNDIFAAPGGMGIMLFDENGNPISGDITEYITLWDVGSERNEAPGMGPNQAPRQAGPNTGFGEGGVTPFDNTTRSLPLAGGIVDVEVTEANGTYMIQVTNVSATSGALDTPIAPLFYATHNSDWSLFTVGENASAGLETQAEDGSPAGLVDEHDGAAGTGMVGAAGTGPVLTGDGYTFEVTPTEAYPYLTFSGMVVQTNDVFFSPSAKGIALLHSNGSPRSAADVEADIARELAIWDAGTEANEVPGVGINQAPRQPAGNTGPADPIPGVRLYNDSTNDLAGSQAGGFAHMTIAHGADPLSFVVTVRNTSDGTVYPGALTPVAWAIHNSDVSLFQVGETASPGLESISEDGDPSTLAAELGAASGVASSGVQAVPVGATDPGPILAGGEYQFTVMADADHPYLSIANMIVPSNDTFLAFGPAGIALLDENGERRSEEELAADIADDLIAWDAGTERNQAGAGGPDQAPRQAGANTGANEGDGVVIELLGTDSVWNYPMLPELLQVTIEVVGDDPMPTDDQVIYISSDKQGTIAGINYKPADILGFNQSSGEWSMVFDGSALGIRTNNLRAFDWTDDGSLAMSFAYPMWIRGLGWVDDSDIVKFIPTSLGTSTDGTFEWYLDGSDVKLDMYGEDIDALTILDNGDLIISTAGGYYINGLNGRDEDLLHFTPTSLGEESSGTWAVAFDGSDVGLTGSPEDVRGAWWNEEDGSVYLTTRYRYSANGAGDNTLSGDGDDIFVCTPGSLGPDTVCTFSLFWDGDDHGMRGQAVNGFTIGGPVELNTQLVRAQSVDDMIEELVGAEMEVEAAADVTSDESDKIEEMDVEVLLPVLRN